MKKCIGMIGNAHLDPVWQWRLLEGQSEILATISSALERLEEYENTVFTCSSAYYYELIEELDENLFNKIKKMVASGRLVPIGGFYIQPDCNMPSGEAFARQGLYSQRYYLEKFNFLCKTGYCVDSFGHNGMLPQLLNQCGMENYVFMRPHKNENPNIPDNLFWWESMDKSRVLTYRIPGTYCVNDLENLDLYLNEAKKVTEETGCDTMCFYGVGNHGGGPTKIQIEHINKRIDDGNDIYFTSPNEFFEQIRKSEAAQKLTVWKDDFQHHASGCYSSHSKIKQLNRKAESALSYAETFNLMSNITLTHPIQKQKLQNLWKTVCFNQFHDILCGCSIKDACDDAVNAYSGVISEAGSILNKSLLKISWSIDTWVDGIGDVNRIRPYDWKQKDIPLPIVVFNPLSWEVLAPIRLGGIFSCVKDSDGNYYSAQKIRSYRSNVDDKTDTVFYAPIPPIGYKVFWAYAEEDNLALPTIESKSAMKSSTNILENQFIRVEFDDSKGAVSGIIDLKTNINLLNGYGALPLIIDDEKSDTWGHAQNYYNKIKNEFKLKSIKLIEEGNIRNSICVKSVYNNSILTQTFTVYNNKPYIYVNCKLNFNENHDMLKLAFNVNAQSCESIYQIPYGIIKRDVNGEEEPSVGFVDCTGIFNGSKQGISIISDSKYSFSVDENNLYMTAARNPIYCDHMMRVRDEDEFDYVDEGISYFSYIIVPHCSAPSISLLTKLSYEIMQPPTAITESYHKGKLPHDYSYVEIENDNVIITCLKEAEDGDGIVIRLQETNGIDTNVDLDLKLINKKISLNIQAYKIMTIRILSDATVKESSFLEL